MFHSSFILSKNHMGSQAAFYLIVIFYCTATFRPFYTTSVRDEKVLIWLQ